MCSHQGFFLKGNNIMEDSSINPHENWQENSSLAETNRYILKHEILCDVTFLAGEDRDQVRAHKCILASRSPVFYAMFCGPLAESKDGIDVPDIEAVVMKTMIRFMYTEDCFIDGHSVMALLYAAKKYEVTALVKRCADFLQNQIHVDNVCTVMEQAMAFDEQHLVKKCLSYIVSHAKEVLKTTGFLLLSKDIVRLIIEGDNLAIAEGDIFKACVEWAKHQCPKDEKGDDNLRDALGELVYLIRFPNMSAAEFTTLVSQTSILSDSEKVAVFQSYVDESLRQDVFISRPRFHVFAPSSDGIFIRLYSIASVWLHDGSPSAIGFRCSQNVMLKGVSLFMPASAGNLTGTLEIVDDKQTLCTKEVCLWYNPSKRFEMLALETPVSLKSDATYYLIQSCVGPNTYYGTRGKKEVFVDGVTVSFFVATERNTRGTNNINQGQFHGLQFA